MHENSLVEPEEYRKYIILIIDKSKFSDIRYTLPKIRNVYNIYCLKPGYILIEVKDYSISPFFNWIIGVKEIIHVQSVAAYYNLVQQLIYCYQVESNIDDNIKDCNKTYYSDAFNALDPCNGGIEE